MAFLFLKENKMKLDTNFDKDVKPEGFDEKAFSIENPAMVFDILRSKIYSDPILAVCREYMCNALDAHREAGTPDKPIEITMPTYDNLYIKIKDYGPGISPERMENVFIKYTASTKRNDNNQIGGFGLGGKAAFAYSDSFNVITNYNGKKYNYICFIDDTKIGKLTLMTEEDTQEPNGTEIVVPIKSSYDISSFLQRIEKVAKHWDVKPHITNSNIRWQTTKSILQGDGWFIAPSDSYSYERSIKILLDNIEYNMSYSSFIATIKHQELKPLQNQFSRPVVGDIYLKFNTGELSLSVNREQLFFDQKTISNLTERCVSLVRELKERAKSEISSQQSYLDACVKFNSLHEVFYSPSDFLDGSKYSDFELSRHISGNGIIQLFASVNSSFYNSYKSRNGVFIIKRGTVSASEKTLVVINDINVSRVSVKHLQKFWDNTKNPSVAIVDASNSQDENFIKKYNPIKLSKYCKVNNREKKDYVKVIVWKMGDDGKFLRSNISDFEASDDKYICNRYNQDSFCFSDYKTMSLEELKRINPGSYSLFSVECSDTSKVEELTEGVENISDIVKDLITSRYSENEYKVHTYLTDVDCYYYSRMVRALSDKIDSEASYFFKLKDFTNLVSNAQNNNNELRTFSKFRSYIDAGYSRRISEDEYETISSSDGFEKIKKKFDKTYPMINVAFGNNYSSIVYALEDSKKINAIADYINLIDKNSSKENN